jgi:hypothetical protein
MATQAYYTWDAAGRPLNPALPVRETVEQLRAAFPLAANAKLFSWYSNDAHYMADPPLDHTPYSSTEWPIQDPTYTVYATDVMHRPDLGVDCRVLFPYWLAEARAGRMPWLKYMIWQATLYSVKNDWQPEPDKDHFDHVHKSYRTDWRDKSVGSFDVTGGTVALTDDDVTKIMNRALKLNTSGEVDYSGDTATVEQLIRSISYYGLVTRNHVLKVEAGLATLSAAVAALATLVGNVSTGDGTGVTVETFRQVLDEELAKIKLGVVVDTQPPTP